MLNWMMDRNLTLVEKFCYLGDMFNVQEGDSEDFVILGPRVRSAWGISLMS